MIEPQLTKKILRQWLIGMFSTADLTERPADMKNVIRHIENADTVMSFIEEYNLLNPQIKEK